jgi:uncharacterized membrane protein
MEQTKKVSGLTFLLWGMIAFGFLGLEFGVLFISRMVDGRSLAEVGNWPIHWYGALFHWTLTIMIWSCGILLAWRWLKKKDLTHLIDFKMTKKTIIYTFFAILFVAMYTLVESSVLGNNTLQVVSEYKGFRLMYGDYALIVTIFQVFYYVFEMLLVFIMIVMFQAMGETLFKNKYIPYGSILLMLTWGMIHFLSHPAGALGVTICALMPGLCYMFGEKKFLPVYVLLLLGFIL